MAFDKVHPVLKEAANEICAILEKHKIAGSFQLANGTHTEFQLRFPKWSALQFVGDGDKSGLAIKSSTSKDDPDHLEKSVHLLLSARDACSIQAAYLIEISDAMLAALKKAGVEVEHEMFGGEIGPEAA